MKYTNIYNKKTLQVDFWPKQVTFGQKIEIRYGHTLED